MCLQRASSTFPASTAAARVARAVELLLCKAENRAWRLLYAAMHPDPDAVLQKFDAVFVIGRSDAAEGAALRCLRCCMCLFFYGTCCVSYWLL